jgi:hypothetical protein
VVIYGNYWVTWKEYRIRYRYILNSSSAGRFFDNYPDGKPLNNQKTER